MQDGSIARERVAAVIVDNILKALSYVKETRETAEQQLKTLEISQGLQCFKIKLAALHCCKKI